MKDWEIIIQNLRNAGWNCGCMATSDGKRRRIWVVAAERSDAGRFIVHADEKLSAFIERKRRLALAVSLLDKLARFFQARRR